MAETINYPHYEINEDGMKSFHVGYVEKPCSQCSKSFVVAANLVEKMKICALCEYNNNHGNKKNTSTDQTAG